MKNNVDARVVVRQFCSIFVFRLPFSGRYAMVALRKVNFNQIPKIIPKIPVSIIKQSVLWKTWLLSRKLGVRF